MILVKFLMWIYLASLFLVIFFIIIEVQVNKNPNTLFGRWWRTHIVGSGDEYDDEI